MMIRSFHLADWFTLANAFCGVGAIFAVMSYLLTQDAYSAEDDRGFRSKVTGDAEGM